MNKLMMDVEDAIAITEQMLAPDRLNSLQELLLRQCWQDKSYQEIAEESGYAFDYVRVVGSQLWQRISSVLISIQAPRRFGKTSLILKILDRANSIGCHTVRINWQQADTSILNDLDLLQKQVFTTIFCEIIS